MQGLLLALLLVVKPALARSRQVSRRLARLARLTDSALGSAFGRCALPVELPRGATWSGVFYTHQPAARGSLRAEAPTSAAIGKAHRPKALPKAERQRDHLRQAKIHRTKPRVHTILARSLWYWPESSGIGSKPSGIGPQANDEAFWYWPEASGIGSKPLVLARSLWY